MTPLKDHDIDEKTSLRRKQLSLQWGDEEIFDCTPTAAETIFIYKAMEVPKKSYNWIGKSLFFWDRHEGALLHCLIREEQGFVTKTLAILADGTLHADGLFFSSPEKFIEELSQSKLLMHKRLKIDPERPLGLILHGSFHSGCTFTFPPDYPPILLAIALANGDEAAAAKILEHPFIADPSLGRGPGSRLAHLLNCAVEESIRGRHPLFFEYLISTYDLLNPIYPDYLFPIVAAVKSNQRQMINSLLELYPSEQFQAAGSAAIHTAVTEGSADLLNWLMQRLGNSFQMKLIPDKEIAFFAALFALFDVKTFHNAIRKWNLSPPWPQLIAELVKSPVNPEVYLQYFQSEGGNIDQLDPQLKVDLLLHAITGTKETKATADFLEKFPSFREILDEALLKALSDNLTVAILLEHGAKPTTKHFEKLLQIEEIGEPRMQKFLQLLESINELADAKEQLSIASSFGPEGMNAVMAKFPLLASDGVFLLNMLNSTWKSAILAGENLVSDTVSIPLLQNEPNAAPWKQSKAESIEKIPFTVDLGKTLSIEMLVDILMPSGQIERIMNFLVERPECISEFWWRVLFSPLQDFSGSAWEALAKATLPLLQGDRDLELLKAFRYFNKPIAYLWLKYAGNIPSSTLMECFLLSIACGDADAVDLFADLGHIEIVDDFGNTLLHTAVQENALPFVMRLIDRGAQRTVRNILTFTPYELALERKQLSICKCLQGPAYLDEVAAMLLSLSAEEMERWLIAAFLNSMSSDLLELLEALKPQVDIDKSASLEKVESFVRFSGTLIVRYPRKQEQNEVFFGYNTGQSSYEEMQYAWGLRCEEQYQEFYKEFNLESHKFLGVLNKFAKPRAHQKGYEEWRMGSSFQGTSLATYFHYRYFFFWHRAQKLYKELLIDTEKFKNTLQLNDEGYQVLFALEGQKAISLSTIQITRPRSLKRFKGRIIHTDPEEIKKLLPYLSQLFEEIKNFPLDASATTLSEELKKMIALFFWLGCHMTITERGNAQYMLMMHRLCYNIHGFQMGPWSPLYVQPDCMALITPFEVFFEKYYDQLFDARVLKLG